MGIREKRHRLPRAFHKGTVSTVFTLCLKGCIPAFTEPEIVNVFKDVLTSVVNEKACIVPVYCFMPDHQHLIITGTCPESDIWKALVDYKQKTGYWMSANKVGISWQKDFYDRLIRRHEDIATHVRYILDNPVRKGLVSSWQEYPFKGSIGCRLEDILGVMI